jgi:predicted CXXCH cytochrome family protein
MTASPRSARWPAILLLAIAGAPGFLAAQAQERTYVGSSRCVACHRGGRPELIQGWQQSAHRSMTVLGPGEALPAGVLLPTSVKQGDVQAILGRTDGEYVFLTRDFQVIASAGWKRREASPPHDGIVPGRPVDASIQCLGCHATGYSASRKAFAEAGIACEACHGPGSLHIKSPAAEGSIVNPAKLAPERSRMICGQCHSLGKDPSGAHPFPVEFLPGGDLTTAFVDAKPKLVRAGWEYSLLVQSSKTFAEQRCTACHDPHGGKAAAPSMLRDATSETCLRCHGKGDARLEFENHWGLGNVIEKPCWECHRPSTHSH